MDIRRFFQRGGQHEEKGEGAADAEVVSIEGEAERQAVDENEERSPDSQEVEQIDLQREACSRGQIRLSDCLPSPVLHIPFCETAHADNITGLQIETSETVMEPKAETSKTVMEPKAETAETVMEPKAETTETVIEPRADESKPDVKKTCHTSHSFEWFTSDKKHFNITCTVAGTVEDSLRKSFQFKKLEGKMKVNKELVILRGGKVISSHFPCCLIQEGERLSVKYVEARQKLKEPSDRSRYARRSPDQYVVFNLLPKGKRKVVKILRNVSIETLGQELAIYALKGEKVKHALKRDGRFQKTIFEKTCGLDDISTNAVTEMSTLVDNLDGKTFQIILLDKSSPPDSQPDSQPGSLDDAYIVHSDLKENCDPSLSSAPAKTDNNPKKKDCMVYAIPDTEKMREILYSQLKKWATTEMKGKEKQSVPKFLRTEFGKNSETSLEVKTGKILMGLSDSVCQVRINETPAGSGFLLFDTFVLTNGHVLKDVFDPFKWQLCGKVTVTFCFESLKQSGVEHEVQEVVGFEYERDVSGYMHDWALLSLCSDQKLPDGLMRHFGGCPPGGNMYIIGHPDGGVKKTDSCWIIPLNTRIEAIDQYESTNPLAPIQNGPCRVVQLLTHTFCKGVEMNVKDDNQILTYNTCFYFGSSGSPVFDSQCKVVAMHSAGYPYKTPNGRDESVIEIGYPLSFIIKHIMLQLEKTERLDVLKNLKKFFTTEPEPMDCD